MIYYSDGEITIRNIKDEDATATYAGIVYLGGGLHSGYGSA